MIDIRQPCEKCAITIILSLAMCLGARAACDPKFGEEIYKWVDLTAGQQSYDLARADYYARTFNYFDVAYDDLNKRTSDAQAELDVISAAIAAAEAAAGEDEVRTAVKRDASATDLLNNLFEVRHTLDVIKRRHEELAVLPTRASFDLDGLGNIGRATLLESLMRLGESAQRSLSGRYSVYVQVSVDEDGHVRDAGVKRNADMVDTVVTAGASYLPEPYVYIVVVIYQIGRLVYESEVCRERVEQQITKMREAFALLPAKLISHDEQFAEYTSAYKNRIALFSEVSDKIKAVLAQSEARSNILFTFNAARQEAANTVLTPAKVELLQKEYETSGDLRRIFDNIAITRFAGQISNLNSFLASRQIALLSACHDVEGIRAAEDQQDALLFGLASLRVFDGRAEFIPLQRLLSRSLRFADAELLEANRLRSSLATRPCLQKETLLGSPHEVRAFSEMPLTLTALDVPSAIAVSTRSGGVLTCVLVRRDGGYFCEEPGGPGTPYSSEFDGGMGDPRADVLNGANDGGYSYDNRQIGEDIAATKANIDNRIDQLYTRSYEAQQALPEWKKQNGAALDAHLQKSKVNTTSDLAASDLFKSDNAPLIADAKAELEEFLKAPANPERISELLQAVDATDLTLPDLPEHSIPADIPLLPGITAPNRVFGSSLPADGRLIQREGEKLGIATGLTADQRRLAEDALSFAAQFQGKDESSVLSRSLVRDSAAVRYYAAGELPQIEVTVVSDDGIPRRAAVTDLNKLPPEALIVRAKSFSDMSASFSARADTLRKLLDGGAGTDSQRNALGEAERLASTASSIFYRGDVVNGASLLQLAVGVLDVATSLAPGISWGRDIYESVTGRNLITGEELTTFERSVAVLGAVSGGLAGGGPKLLRALGKVADLGQSGKEAERIIEVASKIDHGAVEWTEHAKLELNAEDMVRQGIGLDEVEDALDRGTRFFDKDKGTIVSYEIEVEGRMRAAAGVDPNNMKLVTVYPEARTDVGLSQVVSKEFPDTRRFIRLDAD